MIKKFKLWKYGQLLDDDDKDDLGDHVGKAYSLRYEVYTYRVSNLSQYSK